MMIAMTARLARYVSGYIKGNDKNSWTIKKLDAVGKTMAQLVRCLWRNAVTKSQSKEGGIDSNKSLALKTKPEDIMNYLMGAIKFDTINDNIISAFNSANYGVEKNFVRRNITEALDSTNIIDSLSLKTKIDVNLDRNVKEPKVRAVQNSQLFFVDPAKTPDDTGCGIIKNKAITCLITTDVDPAGFVGVLKSGNPQLGLQNIITEHRDRLHPHMIMVNGVPEGWCDMEITYARCVNLRRLNIAHKHTEFIKTPHMSLEIYTDSGRLVVPLAVVTPEGMLAVDQYNARNLKFEDMLSRGYVEYIGSAEIEYLNIAENRDTLSLRLKKIENENQRIRELESELEELTSEGGEINEDVVKAQRQMRLNLEVTRKVLELALKPWHYCQLHSIAQMGIAAALMPFMNTNQAPRVSYQAKMHCQAMSIERSNPYLHSGTTLSMAYPTQPIIKTALDSVYGMSEHPIGRNVTIAIMAWSGSNQEDAIIMNQASRDMGLFMYIKTFIYETRVTNINGKQQRLAKPIPRNEDEAYYYRFISSGGEDVAVGLPSIGAVLREGDCVIGKVEEDGTNIRNVSEFIRPGEEGVVDDVRVTKGHDHDLYVSVKMHTVRIPEVGDKFAARYAQKNTVGRVVSREDMPYSVTTGESPDLILNPHAIPSRMTMGYILELLIGYTSALQGKSYDATGFQPYDTDKFKQILHDHGYNSKGLHKMIDGITGEMMEAQIYMGTSYVQQLIHIARDKIQSRSKGQVNETTRQPNRGKVGGGGVRFGVMESWAATHHGAAHFLHERLCSQSDSYTMVICTNCGTMAVYNRYQKKYVCKQCGEKNKFGKTNTPYVFKLLTQYMASTGIIMRPKAVKSSEYLDMEEKTERANLADLALDGQQTVINEDYDEDDEDIAENMDENAVEMEVEEDEDDEYQQADNITHDDGPYEDEGQDNDYSDYWNNG